MNDGGKITPDSVERNKTKFVCASVFCLCQVKGYCKLKKVSYATCTCK